MELKGLDCDFTIASPPRARGRLKQTAKTKRAKNKAARDDARTVSQLYGDGASLETARYVLDHKPTHDTAKAVLDRLSVCATPKKANAPTPYLLLTGQQTMLEREITSVLSMTLVDRGLEHVVILQNITPGLSEAAVGVTFQGIGSFTSATLTLMRRWHYAKRAVESFNQPLAWIDSVILKPCAESDDVFQQQSDPQPGDAIRRLCLLDEQVRLHVLCRCSLLCITNSLLCNCAISSTLLARHRPATAR